MADPLLLNFIPQYRVSLEGTEPAQFGGVVELDFDAKIVFINPDRIYSDIYSAEYA